jgi:recombinational DNA repair ATPase RecF
MAEKSKKSVKELEIPIVFHNYKLLKDKEVVLTGSNIYFVQGPNKVGKTSFLKALTSLQIAQDDTPVKVTHGESEGFYEATIPASDGTVLTIRHEFTDDGKGKFIAIREDGTKISQVTEIRKLFNYTPIDVSQFFAMSNSAEGRRKQRDIILKLLTDEEREQFTDLDLQEQHYYDLRTEVNKKVDTADSSIKAIVIPKEDELLVPREKEAKDLKTLYEKVRDARKILAPQKQTSLDLETRITRLENEIKEKQKEIDQIKETLQKGKDASSELEKQIAPYEKYSDQEIAEKISTGENILTKITSISTKNDLKKEWTEKWETQKAESDKLTKKIDECRTKKTEIITNSDLPVENISFDDGYLTIDGFQFKESQVCESDAIIILANILAKINPGPIQIIGNAGDLDFEKLELLNKIAEKNNKVMFVDEVVRDSDNIVIVGYEEISKADFHAKLDEAADGKKKKSSKKVTKEKSEHPESPDNASTGPKGPDSTNESSEGEENKEKPLF